MKRAISSIILILFFAANLSSQSITILDKGGWFETAFVKFEATENIDSFSVYFSNSNISEQRIDDQLIRNYGDFFRADIPGLKAGKYALKIVPIIEGTEAGGIQTDSIEVLAHDRTGFAFSNGRTPGAYKADGTPKDNAVVLYISENTKNNISLEVNGANENPSIGIETILEGFKKGADNRPLIVRFIGQITDPEYLDKGDLVVENKNNAASYITLEGIGEDATADGWGIRVKNASNVEIRNLAFMNTDSDEGDDLGLQQDNEYIWIHHCDFFYGGAGGDSDQAKGDGALDCKRSTYVTFSYNHFWDTGKSNLLGLSEGTTEGYFITYHHNWYDHSDSRHPRVRYYSAHVYNNYYDGIAKYGVGSTLGSSVFVEGNYFRNCKYPMLTSMQGSDVFDESSNTNDYSEKPTFSKEDGGTIKAYNNYMVGQHRFVAYGDSNYPNSNVDFDAFVTSSREEIIPATVQSSYGSNTYNNFDTNNEIMYSYVAQSPEEAKATVMKNAGRINGGDFQWTFNNSTEDTNYDVITELKTALINYETQLVAIQGDGAIETGGGGTGSSGGSGEPIAGDVTHNFTTAGLNSDFFDISGNLSDSKGTVSYGDLLLTQCLKMESSTNINFIINATATLTLVFNEGFSGEIKVNGESKTITSGVLSTTIPAGTNVITKDDVANLYLISIDYPSSINELQEKVSIYPIPANKELNIQTSSKIRQVEIYDQTGKLILKENFPTVKINIESLKSGIYVLKLSSNKSVHIKRFSKK